MKLFLFIFAFLLAINIAAGANCGVNCTGGVEDDFKYVRDGSRPKLQEVHSPTLTRAVISIHGNTRDVYNYYCFAKYAIEDAGLYSSTFLIAPRFPLPVDNPPAGAFYWVNSASWKEGGRSHSDTSRISSFEILDDIIIALNDKILFPGLTEIIVIGHSAGGQTIQRYAVASGIDGVSELPIRYIIQNSGSYTYLHTLRPSLPSLSLPTCSACIPEEVLSRTYTFIEGGYDNCTAFNDWKMGIVGGNVYVNRRTAATIRAGYKEKDITYILSQNDTCNTELGSCGCSDSSLDTGCDALQQGYCRLERGFAFYQYLQHYYNAQVHKYDVVPNAAHEGCKVMTSIQSLRALFPSEVPACYNSLSITQTRNTGWTANGITYSQWHVSVSSSSRLYDITFKIDAPAGASIDGTWGLSATTNGYKSTDGRLLSIQGLAPNNVVQFGYIVTGNTRATVSADFARCNQ